MAGSAQLGRAELTAELVHLRLEFLVVLHDASYEAIPQAGAKQHAQPAIGLPVVLEHHGDHLHAALMRVHRLELAVRGLFVGLGHTVHDTVRRVDRVGHGVDRRPLHLLHINPDGIVAPSELPAEPENQLLLRPGVGEHHVARA